MQVAHFVCAAWAHTLCEPFSSGNNYKEEIFMKKRISATLNLGISVIALIATIAQTVINQDIKMFMVYYCLVLSLLCIISIITIIDEIPTIVSGLSSLAIIGFNTLGRAFVDTQIFLCEKALKMWKSL